MSQVCLSLGSNLGFRKSSIRKALREIGKLAVVVKVSRLIRTKAYGKTNQPDFINCAVLIETDIPPETLLDKLLSIEAKLGRVRKEKWGPRKIDIDIIFYGDQVIDTPQLKVPHPDMQNRELVLKPLAEICPDFVHPVLGKKVRCLTPVPSLLRYRGGNSF